MCLACTYVRQLLIIASECSAEASPSCPTGLAFGCAGAIFDVEAAWL